MPLVLKDNSNYAKKDVLFEHCENLAIVSASMNTSKGTPIHLV